MYLMEVRITQCSPTRTSILYDLQPLLTVLVRTLIYLHLIAILVAKLCSQKYLNGSEQRESTTI